MESRKSATGRFRGCSSLEEIKVSDCNENYRSINGVLFTKDGQTLVACPGGMRGEYTVPQGVTQISSNAFEGCSSLKSITLPDGITEIGAGAFSDCSSLKSITLPDGITKIGDWAFSGCSSLESITLPDGITEIGGMAFPETTEVIRRRK